MVTSQTGTQTRQRYLTHSLPLSSALMTGEGHPSALSHGCHSVKLAVHSEVVTDLLLQLNLYIFMESDGIHPRLLKEQDDVEKPLLMIFEWSWEYAEVLVNSKLATIVPVFKMGKKDDFGTHRIINLTSVPGKAMEKIILGGFEKHLKDNTVIGYSLHGFLVRKLCFSNLIPFYDKLIHLVDKGKSIDVISGFQ